MELKPIARRVNIHEGTEFGPHWLLLGPDEFYGNGFTHEALYSGEQAAEMYAEIDRLRADRDCEHRLRKDSDDLATELRLALEAVMSRPSDTGLAWAVLERIHGVGSGGFVRPNVKLSER
jgi:hypothetical protein